MSPDWLVPTEGYSPTSSHSITAAVTSVASVASCKHPPVGVSHWQTLILGGCMHGDQLETFKYRPTGNLQVPTGASSCWKKNVISAFAQGHFFQSGLARSPLSESHRESKWKQMVMSTMVRSCGQIALRFMPVKASCFLGVFLKAIKASCVAFFPNSWKLWGLSPDRLRRRPWGKVPRGFHQGSTRFCDGCGV